MAFHAEVERRIAVLEANGMKCRRRRQHAAEFAYRGSDIFYLPNTKKTAVALSPLSFSGAGPVMGRIGKPSFNSNFSTFPKKRNAGKNPERYGVAFDLDDDSQLLSFLKTAFGAI